MKINKKDLEKALEYLKKHGDAQDLDISIDNNLHYCVNIKAPTLDDTVSISIFREDLHFFPRITKTERL